jgi:hypothetical protein
MAYDITGEYHVYYKSTLVAKFTTAHHGLGWTKGRGIKYECDLPGIHVFMQALNDFYDATDHLFTLETWEGEGGSVPGHVKEEFEKLLDAFPNDYLRLSSWRICIAERPEVCLNEIIPMLDDYGVTWRGQLLPSAN